jgi:hypothetical protein
MFRHTATEKSHTPRLERVVWQGLGGVSGGGKTDEPREAAAGSAAVGRAEAERGARFRRNRGTTQSAQRRRGASGLSLHIAD